MQPVSAHHLLDIWESGRLQPPWNKALMLLAAACPERSFDELEALPIGQRDTRLLMLREQVFGPTLYSLIDCPACAETLNFSLACAQLRGAAEDTEPAHELEDWPDIEPMFIESHGHQVVFRLPDTRDIAHLARMAHQMAMTVESAFLTRCVLEIRRDGADIPLEFAPDEVRHAVIEAMKRADPQALIDIGMSCPACGHEWDSTFDIVDYLWTELDVWARRTLDEVVTLARACGWNQHEILALSPWRRQFYIDLLHRS